MYTLSGSNAPLTVVMAPYPEISTIVTTSEALKSHKRVYIVQLLYTIMLHLVSSQCTNKSTSIQHSQKQRETPADLRHNDAYDGLRNLLRVESQSVQELGTVYTSWPLQLAKPK